MAMIGDTFRWTYQQTVPRDVSADWVLERFARDATRMLDEQLGEGWVIDGPAELKAHGDFLMNVTTYVLTVPLRRTTTM